MRVGEMKDKSLSGGPDMLDTACLGLDQSKQRVEKASCGKEQTNSP